MLGNSKNNAGGPSSFHWYQQVLSALQLSLVFDRPFLQRSVPFTCVNRIFNQKPKRSTYDRIQKSRIFLTLKKLNWLLEINQKISLTPKSCWTNGFLFLIVRELIWFPRNSQNQKLILVQNQMHPNQQIFLYWSYRDLIFRSIRQVWLRILSVMQRLLQSAELLWLIIWSLNKISLPSSLLPTTAIQKTWNPL